MKSLSLKQPSDRVTRSQPLRRPSAEKSAKEQPRRCSRIEIFVHEPVTIPDGVQQAENQLIISLVKKIDDLTAANQAINEQLGSLVINYQSIQNTIATLCEENAALKEENAKIRKNVHQVFDDMDYALGKIQQIEQHAIANEIEISGVPSAESEDLSEVLHRLFDQTGFEFTASTIEDAYRTRPNKKSGLPGSIIVKFDSHNSKNRFITKIKGKLLTSEFISSSPVRPVYVNDHLTKMNRYLFYLARCMRRKGQIKYAWVDNGKVLVKKSDGMEYIIVECPKTLDNLLDRQ
jgi:regulator of replication initiation timing